MSLGPDQQFFRACWAWAPSAGTELKIISFSGLLQSWAQTQKILEPWVSAEGQQNEEKDLEACAHMCICACVRVNVCECVYVSGEWHSVYKHRL